ncbi:hypothetical protein [Nocardioides montaniterrae]
MNDLIDQLGALRTAPAPIDDSVVTADLRRGRRAAGRRRAVRGAGVAACALALGGVTTAIVDSSPGVHSTGVQLVDYTGDQLPGFTVDKVPDGFVLQGATAYSLDIARPGVTSSLDDFEGKIVVSVEANAPATAAPHHVIRARHGDTLVKDGSRTWLVHPDGSRVLLAQAPATTPPSPTGPIDVDGSAGTITTNSEGTKTFRYSADGRTVTIQVWPTIKLSDGQLRELADGVSVTAAARNSVG